MVTISGGNKLEAALNKIASKLKKAASVEVGFQAGATEKDGTSIPMIAAIQEFGAPARGIPPRPFFRTMVQKNSPQWPRQVADLLKASGFDAEKTLTVMGMEMVGQLQTSIEDLTAPALSDVTIMLRGMRSQKRYADQHFGDLIKIAIERVAAGKTNYGASTKPLIDTGKLLASITSTVKT